jgi:hypothetical protein
MRHDLIEVKRLMEKRLKPVIGNTFVSGVSSVGRVIDGGNNFSNLNSGRPGIVLPIGNGEHVFVSLLG